MAAHGLRRNVALILTVAVLAGLGAMAARAQGEDEISKLYRQVDQLYRAGKYSEATELAGHSLATAEAKYGPSHPVTATAVEYLARINRAQGNFLQSEQGFQRALAIREKSFGLHHQIVGFTLANFALLYEDQGRYAEAEVFRQRVVGIMEKTFGPGNANFASALDNLAVLYRRRGRDTEAEPLMKRALSIREAALGQENLDVGISLNNLSKLYEAQGNAGEAELLAMRALAIFEKALGPDHPNVGRVVNTLANAKLAQRKYAEAEPLFRRTIANQEKAFGPGHPDVATAVDDLAFMLVNQDRLSEAEPLLKRSLEVREKALGIDSPIFARALHNLARLYQLQGRGSEAEALYQRALTIRETSLGPDHGDVEKTLNNLAVLALTRSDWSRALDYWRRSTGILVRRTQRGAAELGQAITGKRESDAQLSSTEFAALIKVGYRHRADGQMAREMFQTAQWAQGSQAAQSLLQMAARGAKGDPKLAAMVRERQDLVSDWQQRDQARTAAVSQEPRKRNAKEEAANAERLTAIDARIAAIDASLKVAFPSYSELANPLPVSVEEVQAQLTADEALVLFLDTSEAKPTTEETFIWIVTKSELRWVRSGYGTPALKREVAALRCGLDATGWTRETTSRCTDLLKLPQGWAPGENDPLPFDAARAHALYKALFGEVSDLIKGRHLLIVPSGPMTQLPFQVLVTEPPVNDNHRAIAWLARDHATTVLPAVSSLKALRRIGKPSMAKKQMIGFGNPLLDGDQQHPQYGIYDKEQAARARAQTSCAGTAAQRTEWRRGPSRSVSPIASQGSIVDVERVRRLSPLPETADELCAVARDLKTDVDNVRLGARATEREVKALSTNGQLAQYRVLHFATHGALAGQLSATSEPGLVLTPPATASEEDDGYLSASEIASLKLDADWVILSACNTAGPAGGATGAEALSGLARAFFYAQARALLVSHWAVNSEAAVKLITASVGETARDRRVGRSEALRRAMLAIIDNGAKDEKHPSYWAPFVVVGEGAAAR